MSELLRMLEGGDRRSIGRVAEVVRIVEGNQSRTKDLILGLRSDDPIIRMRSADALEKATSDHHSWLQPYKRILLEVAKKTKQQEVRWHMAQIVPRLWLTPSERQRLVKILLGYLEDKSKIVQVMAIQALADLAQNDNQLLKEVVGLVETLAKTGSGAVRARCRKLLLQIKKIADLDYSPGM